MEVGLISRLNRLKPRAGPGPDPDPDCAAPVPRASLPQNLLDAVDIRTRPPAAASVGEGEVGRLSAQVLGAGLARPVWTRGRPSSAPSSARPRRSSSGASTPRSSGPPPSTLCLDPCLRFGPRLSYGILPLGSFGGWDACRTCTRCNPRAFG